MEPVGCRTSSGTEPDGLAIASCTDGNSVAESGDETCNAASIMTGSSGAAAVFGASATASALAVIAIAVSGSDAVAGAVAVARPGSASIARSASTTAALHIAAACGG